MITVLAVSDVFAPGYRGGSTRHLVNAVARLGDRIAFRVLTYDRDTGSAHPYDLPLDTWVHRPDCHVHYTTPAGCSLRRLARTIGTAAPDVILMNSVFSRLAIRVLALHRAGAIGRAPILLGPEGEFHAGALAKRGGRKRAFVAAVRWCGGYRHVVWRATTADEVRDVRGLAGADAPIVVAPVISEGHPDGPEPRPLPKSRGHVRLVYLSRVTPKKNLIFLLRLLEGFDLPLDLDIVGPVDDSEYWRQCRGAMARSRHPVVLNYLGEVRPDEVAERFSRAHVSVLPTLGENFGFTVLESLRAARPVLVSTETPWKGLAARGAGWDLPLGDRAAWDGLLRRLVHMEQHEYDRWSAGALALAREHEAGDRAPALLEDALCQLAATRPGSR